MHRSNLRILANFLKGFADFPKNLQFCAKIPSRVKFVVFRDDFDEHLSEVREIYEFMNLSTELRYIF